MTTSKTAKKPAKKTVAATKKAATKKTSSTKPNYPPSEVVEALVTGRSGDAHHWLGVNTFEGTLWALAFEPGAEEAAIVDGKGKKVADLKQIHEAGLFCAKLTRKKWFEYEFQFQGFGSSWSRKEPADFTNWMGDTDIWLLNEGRHLKMYEKLGAHPTTIDGVEGTAFAVWAPNASRVSVIGEWNTWDGRRNPMRAHHSCGVWEVFIPGVKKGDLYKFELLSRDGHLLPAKADPVGFRSELPPAQASVVEGPAPQIEDADRTSGPPIHVNEPVSIYEVHLGSWMRAEGADEAGGDSGRFLTYDELADKLVGYAVDMGFTHLEFLPVSEYPFSGSWGYQPVGMFAPTSRFGDPEGFARLVKSAHEAGLGVILDWVPAHFPSDAHGLAQFDGTHLYEHEDPRLGFHKDWNTLIYNFGRTEVANFLTANALYWLERQNVDGLRVDAVASMLYLDYSRNEGEWVPNVHGGRENLEAISLLREVNTQVGARAPGRATIAEESTAFPGVSRPVHEGGLGFHFKWNMGWMHDSLHYMQEDPVNRSYHHHHMTFSLHYAYTENFVLPISHDEVVHGKGSLLTKMPGDRWQKFANLRAYFGFMWTHPGKKLLFMGCEFAQEREWNHDISLDWHLLENEHHAGMQRLIRDLNKAYRELKPLHELDCSEAGFEWIDGGDTENSVFSFERKDSNGNAVVVVANMTPVVRTGYAIGMPSAGRWREALNTDAEIYGGSGVGNGGSIEASDMPIHGREAGAHITLPPLSTLILVKD